MTSAAVRKWLELRARREQREVQHSNGMFARLQDLWIIRSVCEEDEYRLRQLMTAPDLIVDIGGHIGSFSRLAHELFPITIILCVEPFKDNYDLCVKNVGDSVIVENVAIGYDADIATIYQPSHDASSSSLICKKAIVANNMIPIGEVSMVGLSSLLAKHQMTGAIDFMKLDCEGAELGIIEQDQAIHRTRHIAGEWHGESIRQRIDHRFRALGWVVEYTNVAHGQGLFFADNPHV